MKKQGIIRDRKEKTLLSAGTPRLKNIAWDNENTKWRYVYKRHNGMAIIKHPKKEKYGLINMLNEIVIDTKYDFCCYPKRGHIFIMQKGKWGFVNYAGKVICPCEYSHIYSFKYGVAITRKGTCYGLVNQDGEAILKCKYTREQALKERQKILHRM